MVGICKAGIGREGIGRAGIGRAIDRAGIGGQVRLRHWRHMQGSIGRAAKAGQT